MKSRQYYKDTVSNSVYHIDLCYGDVNECLSALSNFIENFNDKSMLFLSFDIDKSEIINKFIPENIKNHVSLWTDVGSIDNLIQIVDHSNTTRYRELDTYNPITHQKNPKKDKQKVFNITKNYVRELKIKRVLNET